MKKTIVIHDDYIEIVQDGYNIIELTIYDDGIVTEAYNLMQHLNSEYGV